MYLYLVIFIFIMSIRGGESICRMRFLKTPIKIQSKKIWGFSVYNTGFQQCCSGYSWGPAVRDHFLVHFISSGKGQFHHDGKVFHLSAGDLFLVYPHRIASYKADEISPWEYFWVGFNGGDSDRLLGMTDFTRDNPVIHCKNTNMRYKNLLMQIYNQRGSRPWNDTEMTGILYQFLAELMKSSCLLANKHGIRQTYVKNALHFIQCNYTSDISVEDIACYIRISRSHLYRLFIDTMGISPKEYLMNFRINQACGLLRTSDMTIAQISASTGFNDPLYFTRVFKTVKGITPSQMKAVFDH